MGNLGKPVGGDNGSDALVSTGGHRGYNIEHGPHDWGQKREALGSVALTVARSGRTVVA